MGQVPAERVLALRYEDVLADPVKLLGQSADFCGLRVSQNQIESVAKNIRADRANAYESDVELANFAAERSAALSAHGYALPGASG